MEYSPELASYTSYSSSSAETRASFDESSFWNHGFHYSAFSPHSFHSFPLNLLHLHFCIIVNILNIRFKHSLLSLLISDIFLSFFLPYYLFKYKDNNSVFSDQRSYHINVFTKIISFFSSVLLYFLFLIYFFQFYHYFVFSQIVNNINIFSSTIFSLIIFLNISHPCSLFYHEYRALMNIILHKML